MRDTGGLRDGAGSPWLQLFCGLRTARRKVSTCSVVNDPPISRVSAAFRIDTLLGRADDCG